MIPVISEVLFFTLLEANIRVLNRACSRSSLLSTNCNKYSLINLHLYDNYWDRWSPAFDLNWNKIGLLLCNTNLPKQCMINCWYIYMIAQQLNTDYKCFGSLSLYLSCVLLLLLLLLDMACPARRPAPGWVWAGVPRPGPRAAQQAWPGLWVGRAGPFDPYRSCDL